MTTPVFCKTLPTSKAQAEGLGWPQVAGRLQIPALLDRTPAGARTDVITYGDVFASGRCRLLLGDLIATADTDPAATGLGAASAVERFTECLRASRVEGYRPGEAQALRCLGQSHRALGAYLDAADANWQAVAISADLGDRLTATHAACWLGDVLVRQGEHRKGRRLFAQSLWTYREFVNLWGEAATLYALVEAQLAVGRIDCGAALRLRSSAGPGPPGHPDAAV
ncbi:hypothetical protein [Streptomyces atratus]|uniref:hypothetical protein n=1 Tax=Streptomyces atratus TaxID=1893 RepID=UPI0022586E6D|nr:hypothetical protein [Streptomyces atratus]MCX5345988.1 hypothetical protein [Streptomyces atratus]